MANLLRFLLAGGCLGIWGRDLRGAQPERRQDNDLVFDVRRFVGRGDGITSDTVAINEAIRACGKHGGGQVYFPPGRYLTGTIRLCSNLNLFLAAGAVIVGTTNLTE